MARARGEREPQDRPVRTSAARGEAVNQKHDVDVLPACAKDLKIRGRAGAVQPYHEVPGIPLPDLGRARNRGKPFCIPNRFQVSRRMYFDTVVGGANTPTLKGANAHIVPAGGVTIDSGTRVGSGAQASTSL